MIGAALSWYLAARTQLDVHDHPRSMLVRRELAKGMWAGAAPADRLPSCRGPS